MRIALVRAHAHTRARAYAYTAASPAQRHARAAPASQGGVGNCDMAVVPLNCLGRCRRGCDVSTAQGSWHLRRIDQDLGIITIEAVLGL
jgi:hypothetical protein